MLTCSCRKMNASSMVITTLSLSIGATLETSTTWMALNKVKNLTWHAGHDGYQRAGYDSPVQSLRCCKGVIRKKIEKAK